MHVGQGAAPVALFVFSIFLGYLYYKTHRIYPSLVAHFCLNALTVIQLWVKWAH